MDFLELGGSEHVAAAVVDLEGVVQFELFEKPDNALGAGFVEPGYVSVSRCVFVGNATNQ